MKTLKITYDTWLELTMLKIFYGDKSLDKTISRLIEKNNKGKIENEKK